MRWLYLERARPRSDARVARAASSPGPPETGRRWSSSCGRPASWSGTSRHGRAPSTARARSASSSIPTTRATATRPRRARLLELAFERTACTVSGRLEPRNTASARVLEKLGMRREAHLIENEGSRASGRASGLRAARARMGAASSRARLSGFGARSHGSSSAAGIGRPRRWPCTSSQPQRGEPRPRLRGLDALGDDVQPEPAAEVDDRVDDRGVALVVRRAA